MLLITLSWWMLSGGLMGIAGMVFLFFKILAHKNRELEKMAFRMQVLADQEKHDVMKLARLEYELSKMREEKEQFALLQQKFEHDRAHFFKELEASRMHFESERHRITQAHALQEAEKLNNVQRVWNDHEIMVVSLLKSLCALPESFFHSFDNAHLPPLWDTSIKPDFLIQYLEGFVVFDAKKSKNIKTYIDVQIKSTAEKYSSSSSIFKLVFFVFPEDDVSALSKRIYSEKGYTFFIVSPSALPSILFLLKRMEALQTLSNFNPEERDALIALIVGYDAHVGLQNAMNILLTERSFEVLAQKKNLPESFQKEIENAKELKSSVSVPSHEARRLVFYPKGQEERVGRLKTNS